ncbi:MAG TPA: L-seryl-tRNA(Sec) selenium transferase, partial [Burkholderiales bacterium]
SGAVPVDTLPSAALAIRPRHARRGAALRDLAAALRRLPIPVIGRIADDALLLDLRCLEREQPFLDNLAALERADDAR